MDESTVDTFPFLRTLVHVKSESGDGNGVELSMHLVGLRENDLEGKNRLAWEGLWNYLLRKVREVGKGLEQEGV